MLAAVVTIVILAALAGVAYLVWKKHTKELKKQFEKDFAERSRKGFKEIAEKKYV